MFSHLWLTPRDKQGREDKARPPHRLALAVAAAGGGDSPRAASRLTPAAQTASLSSGSGCRSPRSPQGCQSSRVAALPAYRARSSAPGGVQQLPQVQAAGEQPAAAYTSLDGLSKMAELHKGKHSTVHNYLDTRSGRVVAVKTYYKRTMAKRHFRNCRREVDINRMLARQGFTGTVQLLGAFEDDSHIHLVMESCAGGDLYRRLVRAGGVLGEAEVCHNVVVPLLLTLTFLHANHIAHRDIKPENIMFAADGSLRLGDFGLSIDAARERPTSRVGTLDYMAPEVVGMPSPDDMQRLGLAPHKIGHYGCKVDVWAVGVLAYELLCGRPPFEVEDVKLTEQHIQFAEVAFPPHISPLCRSFIQQALTKRPESRPSAAQLFQHRWVQRHYQQLLAAQAQAQPAAATMSAAAAAAAVAAAAGLLHTPELRRTVSQPPSPSKSMPGGTAGGGAGNAVLTPAAAAAVLAPFLPLSQAKMAHKVRLLSAGRPPSSGKPARLRRRVSDPLARVLLQPPPAGAGAAELAVAAAAAAGVPPTTPPPAAAAPPACASDGAGSVAPAADVGDDAASGAAAPDCFEQPGTPGLKTTPLPRQRPVVQPRAPLGRTPFLLPLVSPGSSGTAVGTSAPADLQPVAAGVRGKTAAGRSRFAAAAENDEGAASASAAMRASAETMLSSPGAALVGRASSLTSLCSRDGGSSSNLQVQERGASFTSAFGGSSGGNLPLQARASSFTSYGGGGSSGSLQLAARASSLTSFGGRSSGNLSSPGSKQLPGKPPAGEAGQQAGTAAELLQRLQL